MHKTRIDDKFALTYTLIQRVRELVKEKDKRVLLNITKKLTSIALQEFKEGKVIPQKLVQENTKTSTKAY